ncbi:hypothetical protein FJTKL_05047 [Diaporthe vaccinii]|uniref:Uncharacterized protein n=1 Tax=Diaporthe vaccinii TaxID=105482 RepID=A0ABR4EZ06_9PEZI
MALVKPAVTKAVDRPRQHHCSKMRKVIACRQASASEGVTGKRSEVDAVNGVDLYCLDSKTRCSLLVSNATVTQLRTPP